MPLAEVKLMGPSGSALKNEEIQRAEYSGDGSPKDNILCFDGIVDAPCIISSDNSTIKTLSAMFPCPGSGLEGLNKVEIYNTP